MTWFGTVSAWTAMLMAAMFAVNAYFQVATGVSAWLYMVVAAALALGGFRTLRKLSGGLRLLAGAWGIAAGVLATPLSAAFSSSIAQPGAAEVALALVAFVGLALTVLHKETK